MPTLKATSLSLLSVSLCKNSLTQTHTQNARSTPPLTLFQSFLKICLFLNTFDCFDVECGYFLIHLSFISYICNVLFFLKKNWFPLVILSLLLQSTMCRAVNQKRYIHLTNKKKNTVIQKNTIVLWNLHFLWTMDFINYSPSPSSLAQMELMSLNCFILTLTLAKKKKTTVWLHGMLKTISFHNLALWVFLW